MLRETLRSPGFHSFADLKKFGFAVEIVLDFYRRVLEPLEKKARVNYSRQEQSGLTFQMQLPSGKQGIITMNGLSYFVNSPELNNVIN
jgi:hypothetical protein